MGKYKLNRHYLFPFFIFFILVFFFSFLAGKYPISPLDVIKILLSKIFPIERTWKDESEVILFNIRLPRIIIALLIGAALSLSGLIFQGLFQNPLVSPDVLGSSQSAGFGAALGIYLGLSYINTLFMSFLFGMLSVIIVMSISKKLSHNKILSFVLSGIMVGSLSSSGISFLKLVADTENTLPQITYFLMGSLSSTRDVDLKFAITIIILSIIPLFLLSWQLNILTQGDEEARSMGINTNLIRNIVIVLITLIISTTVAIAGVIGWVGLVVPHIIRNSMGCDYRKTIPSSVLFGSAFLLFVDTISRIITSYEVPIGILTSFIGAPFFLYILMREGKKL